MDKQTRQPAHWTGSVKRASSSKSGHQSSSPSRKSSNGAQKGHNHSTHSKSKSSKHSASAPLSPISDHHIDRRTKSQDARSYAKPGSERYGNETPSISSAPTASSMTRPDISVFGTRYPATTNGMQRTTENYVVSGYDLSDYVPQQNDDELLSPMERFLREQDRWNEFSVGENARVGFIKQGE